MKNSKKFLSLALTLAMLLSAVFCTGAVANAEDTTTPAASAVLLTHSTTEDDMDWEQDAFGPNLIPDSTVAEWTQDTETGTWSYNNYYASGSTSAVENPNAWWGSKSLSNSGYEGPGVKGYVTKEDSHTNDGSGALHRNALNGWWYLPLKSMSAGYYVITFWAKSSTTADVTLVVMTSGGGEIGARLTLDDVSTTWKRYTVLTYTTNGKFMEIGNWGKIDISIDEIEQYKVTNEYAEACIAAGNKLLNGKETYVEGTDFDSAALTVDASIDFDSFGTNLFPDPTVNEFVDDGAGGKVYDKYYSVDIGDDGATNGSSGTIMTSAINNPNAIFAKHPYKDFSVSSANMWNSMKSWGATVYDTAASHTQDGSGLLVVPANKWTQHLVCMPTLSKNSYYVVTFWAKSDASDARLRLMNGTGEITDTFPAGDTVTYFSVGDTWVRETYIFYTGNTDRANLRLSFYTDNTDCKTYVDDFGVYKLDAKYGSICKSAGKLYTEAQYEAILRTEDTTVSSDNARLKIPSTYVVSTPITPDDLGTNLCTDSTVADWNGETYNTSGWWTKVPFNNPDALYGSMYTRGYLTNDTTKSHTQDGSGAIVKPSDASTVYLPLTLPNLKSYYLVTAWIKSDGNSVQTGPYTIGSELLGAKAGETFNGWRQVAWIIYQGGTKITNPSMCVYATGEIVIDEFGIYELDYEFGKKCIAAGTWATGASSQDDVTFTANSTQTITATDGYFIPYGAVMTSTGTVAEKLGNGQFYAATAGTYSCAEFKYPTGTVGTFGASVKKGDDTVENVAEKSGIQFGSLVTDNLSVDAGGTGTLVFRGNFEAFRNTFPTKTRNEVLAMVYKALKDAEEDAGQYANKAVKLTNAGKSVVVMYVPQTKYMWKNSANTELQYAVRVYGIATKYGDEKYTAIGYVTKDGAVTFSNETKTAIYNEEISK